MNDVEKLFADLRADEIGRVRPPGADAVRATVRRRRGRVSVVAVVAVLLVATGIGGRLTAPATGINGSDALSPAKLAELLRWSEQSLATSGYPGVTMGSGQILDAGSYTESAYVAKGEFSLHAVCGGYGGASVDVDFIANAGAAGPRRLGRVRVPCQVGVVPGRGELQVTAPSAGRLVATVTPDDASADRAALAFSAEPGDLTEPFGNDDEEHARWELTVRARGHLPAVSAGTLARTFGNVTDVGWASLDEGPIGTGRHRVTFACAGRGAIVYRVRVRTGTETTTVAQSQVTCDGAARAAEFTVERAGDLLVDQDPNGDALNSGAGWSYLVDRIR